LAQLAAETLVLEFRSRSRKTPHTTDFLTTMLAVAAIVEWLQGHKLTGLDELVDGAQELVTAAEEPSRELAARFGASNRFTFLGAGPSLGVALYAAEKLWEAGGLEAHAFELEEFAHGAHLLVDAGDPVFIVAPPGKSSGRAAEIADGLAAIEARAVPIDGGTANLPEEWSPFATAVAVQWLCHAIATEKGYDVVRKDGRHAERTSRYLSAHTGWTRA
jgi:fructoselysine-6-P-deglycase FrlB-like protein